MRAKIRACAAARYSAATMPDAAEPPPSMTPMDRALAAARAAGARGEVPIGCVIVGPEGAVLAEAGNRTEELKDPTAHAELLAIRAAAAVLGSPRLVGCDLYVTLEPCPMCAQAISFARLRRVYWGASDPKGGGIEQGPRIFDQPTCHHRPELYPGVGEREAGELLRAFFRERR
jgi:tRNA(Arg) A34 adenosine deaminase TadA